MTGASLKPQTLRATEVGTQPWAGHVLSTWKLLLMDKEKGRGGGGVPGNAAAPAATAPSSHVHTEVQTLSMGVRSWNGENGRQT